MKTSHFRPLNQLLYTSQIQYPEPDPVRDMRILKTTSSDYQTWRRSPRSMTALRMHMPLRRGGNCALLLIREDLTMRKLYSSPEKFRKKSVDHSQFQVKSKSQQSENLERFSP